jgi:thiol-disulfide isomerase/thioredoxin
MAPAQNRTGVLLDSRVMFVGGGVALVGVLVLGFFIWMVPNAAKREAKAACTGMVSQPPLNPALCPNGASCTYPIPAPDFTALDHDGKPVTLKSYRGKVVLLNFWASWCGVCETEKPHLKEMAAELGDENFVVIALASDHNWTDVMIAIIAALAPDSGLDEVRAMKLVHGPVDPKQVVKIVEVLKTHPKQADKILGIVQQRGGDELAQAAANALKLAPPVALAEELVAYKHALPDGVPFDVLLDQPNGDDNIGKIAAAWGIKAVPESALIDKQGNIRHYFVNKRDWQMPVSETCLRSVIDE